VPEEAGGPVELTVGSAQRTLRFVDRRDRIVVVPALERARQVGETLAVALDVIGGDGELGRCGGAHRTSVPTLIGIRGRGGATRHRDRATPRPRDTPVGSVPAVIPVPVRDDLRVLEGYHSPQVDVRVRLNTNESPGEPPAAWRDAFAAELSRVAWNRYPDRSALGLREAIGATHGVSAEQVFVANGSNEVLQTLLLAYAGPGRNVATFEPTYQMHGQIARVTGATVVETPRRDDFTLDVDAALAAIAESRPMVTFLCSPNNPTGLVEPEANVRAVLDAVPGLLVVDEAYAQFAPWSAMALVEESRPLVVTRTFSKTWSMAAARLGYLVGPTWLVAELEKVVLPYHLDAAKQIGGRIALRFVDEMEERVAMIVSERERIASTLDRLPVEQVPSGANFILFRPRGKSGRHVWEALLERDVLVRDCSSWPRLANCLRVTIGTPEENGLFLGALEEVVR
jgi:histidinol-phosphate aminotransferase